MLRKVAVAAALAFVCTGSAWATCPGGGNDPLGTTSGVLTCNAAAAKCEQKAAGNVANKLVKAIIKCHSKQANAAFKAVAYDEETCEAAAIAGFTAKTIVADCPCINVGGLAALAESVLDSLNYYSYCEDYDSVNGVCNPPSIPVDPTYENTGCVPNPTLPGAKDRFKAADKTGKCVAGMVKDWLKCHSTASKDYVKNIAFSDSACVDGPIPGKPGKAAIERFNACMGKAGVGSTAAACNSTTQPQIIAATDAQLDGAAILIFCTSPSGAFVQ